MAFEWELNDLSLKACEFIVNDSWDVKNSNEMIIIQVEAYFIMSQITIDNILKDNFEIAF